MCYNKQERGDNMYCAVRCTDKFYVEFFESYKNCIEWAKSLPNRLNNFCTIYTIVNDELVGEVHTLI